MPRGIENLIPTSKLSKDEARTLGKKGGIKSGEVRRQRKTQKQQLELLLALPVKDMKAKSQIESLGLTSKEIDNQMAMNIAMYKLILSGEKGAVQAYNSFIEILGDKNTEKKDLEIKRLQEEIGKLQLEQEKLKQEMAKVDDDTKGIKVIIGDVADLPDDSID